MIIEIWKSVKYFLIRCDRFPGHLTMTVAEHCRPEPTNHCASAFHNRRLAASACVRPICDGGCQVGPDSGYQIKFGLRHDVLYKICERNARVLSFSA